jgi:predicted SAM-dependent methyltransferase
MSDTKMLNIGCGATYHPDWINLDVLSADPSILPVDINDGLPFPSDSATACYSAHVLEHLDKIGARNLLTECFRVLKKSGGIRLVVPDLETIAREYLRILDAIKSGEKGKDSEYDWIMLEMYDQTVRNNSGGEMASFLVNLKENERTFVRSRIGAEAEKFWRGQQETSNRFSISRLVYKDVWNRRLKSLREKLAGWMVLLIAGNAAFRNFKTGIFRNSGEVHQWMYDQYSLTRLLEQVGFVDIRICAANESRILNYETYTLDVIDGNDRKPDSLYIEASKP